MCSDHGVVDGDGGGWGWHEGVSHLLITLLMDLWGLGVDGGLSVHLGVVKDNILLLWSGDEDWLHWLGDNLLSGSLLLLLLPSSAAPSMSVVGGASDGLNGFLGVLEPSDEPEVGHHGQEEDEFDDLAASGFLVLAVVSSTMWSLLIIILVSVELLGDAALDWGAC